MVCGKKIYCCEWEGVHRSELRWDRRRRCGLSSAGSVRVDRNSGVVQSLDVRVLAAEDVLARFGAPPPPAAVHSE